MLLSSIGATIAIETLQEILLDSEYAQHKYFLDINYQDENGWTAIHCAAFFGFDDTMSALINLGADPNIKTNSGETADDIYKYVYRYS